MGLYRQKYCGCIVSFKKTNNIKINDETVRKYKSIFSKYGLSIWKMMQS